MDGTGRERSMSDTSTPCTVATETSRENLRPRHGRGSAHRFRHKKEAVMMQALGLGRGSIPLHVCRCCRTAARAAAVAPPRGPLPASAATGPSALCRARGRTPRCAWPGREGRPSH